MRGLLALALLLPAIACPRPAISAAPHETAQIVVRATANDWVSVADAAGHVILGRLLHRNDRLALPEGPGYVFTAGNAAATTLLIDGRPAPPLGAVGQVVSNQPLDPALIAAGRLPAQLAAARSAATTTPAKPSAAAPIATSASPRAAYLQPAAIVVPRHPPIEAASAPAHEAAPPEPAVAPTGVAAPPAATTVSSPSAAGATIALTSGAGRVISLGRAAASVFTADPKVADVRPASPTSLFVLGVAPGETTIAALDQAGHPIAQYRVIVTPSAFGPDAAAAMIARLMPGAQVTLSAVPDGLVVAGTVATAADAAEIMALVHGYVDAKQTVHDELTVLGDIQVSLQVRIAEMSRSITRELGVNWQALGSTGGKITANFMAPSALAFLNTAENTFNLTYQSGHTNVNAIIDALAQDQLARMLAEPNLTAMSGQTASFLVGGEFPIPIAMQNGSISVQFQPYGVSLSFIPTVLADNRISLRVRPEVSELTTQGAVQLSEGNSTIQIPALLVRRTETTVELGSGQSFAIAGLLQDQATQIDQGLPGLNEVPILGALFNSDSFQHNETELVIVVTPYIVRPVNHPSALRLPTDGWSPPSDLERILFHRQQARGVATRLTARIPGDAGFIAQ